MTNYWIDPSHLTTPSDTIKNVSKMRIDMTNLPEEFAMRENNCDLTNLENLEICDGSSSENIVPMLSRFKDLKKLKMHLVIHIDYLLDILRFLANMKTLNISVCLHVTSELEEEAAKDIFTEALEIVIEKFPFPDVRILDLNISEIWDSEIWDEDRPKFSISYGESGAKLNEIPIAIPDF